MMRNDVMNTGSNIGPATDATACIVKFGLNIYSVLWADFMQHACDPLYLSRAYT